jgi:4-amino-4-deoxy-L-arabinose transferase-like glycosyltransferase
MAEGIKNQAAEFRGSGEKKAIDRIADRYHTDRYVVYLVITLALFFLFHIIKGAFVPLHIDEAYWWLLTKRPLQAAYYLHPLFKVLDLLVTTKIFGDNLFAIRLGSAIWSTSALFMVFILSKEMFKEKRWAFYATLLVALLPLTNYWMVLGHQESFLILGWLVTTYLVWIAVSRNRKGFWYLAGLSLGITLLNNMRSSLFIPCILLFLLTSRENRTWLRRKEPYLALCIPIIMFIPSFLWYVSKDFQPITDQLSNHPGFLHNGFLGYLHAAGIHILEETFVFSPFVWLLSILSLVYGCYLGYFDKRGKDNRFQYLFCLSCPIIIFYVITAGTPYWAFPGHLLSLIAAFGAFPILLSRSSNKRLERYWFPVYVTILFIVLIFVTMPTLLVTQGDLIQNDWKALSEDLEGIAATMPGDVYLAAPYWAVPTEVAYYDLHRGDFAGYTQAFVVYEHPVWGSGSSDYAPWVPLEDLVGKNLIFVDVEKNPDDFRTPASYWTQKLTPYFESVEGPIVFSYKKWFSDVRNYWIFKCYGFKGPDAAMDDNDVRRYVDENS